MKPEWKNLLENDGAEFATDGSVASFGNPERERRVTTTGNVFCDLSQYGLIAAYGEDAESFLQGQFSNDMKAVDNSHSQLSSYCNPKGRMIANFRIFKREETYYLCLPQPLIETTLRRLRLYVLRSRVTLDNADTALVRMGLSGPDAPNLLLEVLGCLPPSHIDEAQIVNDISIIRIMGVYPRFEIYGPLDAMRSLWAKLNVQGAPVGTDCWGLLNVLAGLPIIQAENSEAFVPQMANLDLIGGISFKKGCYTGQEIVARMHYLGTLKRRTYLVHIDSKVAENGSEILVTDDEEKATGVGRLVEAYRHPDGGLVGLAVLQISCVEEGRTLRLKLPKGPKVTIGSLPYSLEVAEAG